MKLADVSHGPKWILWVSIAVLAVLSIVLLSGHGSSLVSGYNTEPQKEKEKYDAKKLSRTTGIGMSVITLLLLFMAVFERVLPADFAYLAGGIIVVDALFIVIGCNTVCRKR